MLNQNIILASGSPRRKELLGWTGWRFSTLSVDIDESPFPGENPESYVLRLALEKLEAALDLVKRNDIVLAADTTVAFEDQILGKPLDDDQAVEMLTELRGKTHQVLTGIAIGSKDPVLSSSKVIISQVPMREYSDAEIQAYVASGDPMDKAGAYAIQNHTFHPVTDFSGCFANVMGLPVCDLINLFRQIEIFPVTEVPAVCQQNLKYLCPVFQDIYPEIGL
ncbi:MAG: septum formation protein Maf [Anaerolineaceae bacterium]|nr:septum formation protein Maf [Anaerolineaceae bacterium]